MSGLPVYRLYDSLCLSRYARWTAVLFGLGSVTPGRVFSWFLCGRAMGAEFPLLSVGPLPVIVHSHVIHIHDTLFNPKHAYTPFTSSANSIIRGGLFHIRFTTTP